MKSYAPPTQLPQLLETQLILNSPTEKPNVERKSPKEVVDDRCWLLAAHACLLFFLFIMGIGALILALIAQNVPQMHVLIQQGY